jgi:hypothetical protein
MSYPIEAIGTSVLLIAAVVSSGFDRSELGRAAPPLLAATALSLLGLVLTVKAAPIMLSLSEVTSPAALQRAFEEFFLWRLYLRGTVYVLTFVIAIWVLPAISGTSRSRMAEN